MDEKTKKKRVTAQKRAVRKNPEVAKTIPVEPAAPVPVEPKVEAKKVKRSTKGTSKSVGKKSAPVNAARVKPAFEQIQVRAYFISERRRKLGIPGDEHQDWIAAEQELRSELVVR
jgi:Protein of unknown function (DUF2934)